MAGTARQASLRSIRLRRPYPRRSASDRPAEVSGLQCDSAYSGIPETSRNATYLNRRITAGFPAKKSYGSGEDGGMKSPKFDNIRPKKLSRSDRFTQATLCSSALSAKKPIPPRLSRLSVHALTI